MNTYQRWLITSREDKLKQKMKNPKNGFISFLGEGYYGIQCHSCNKMIYGEEETVISNYNKHCDNTHNVTYYDHIINIWRNTPYHLLTLQGVEIDGLDYIDYIYVLWKEDKISLKDVEELLSTRHNKEFKLPEWNIFNARYRNHEDIE